jgi:hypothetical protein
MPTVFWVMTAIIVSFVLVLWVIRVKLLGKHLFPHFTQIRSLKQKRRWWIGGLVLLFALVIWWFWSDLASLRNTVFGPDFPMWGYAAIVGGIIIVGGLLSLNKEGRARVGHMSEWIIGFAAVGGALVVFASWEKEDALCPDKQSFISVPATGMLVNLESCWSENFVTLDLRQTGATVLNFSAENAVTRGRTVNEFAYLKSGYPGSINGHARLYFNAAEMRKYGMTTLPLFVGPSGNQPGAVPQFNDADLQALAR